MLAKQEGVSVDPFVTTALAEKLSALLTEEYPEARAACGDRGAFERALAAVAEKLNKLLLEHQRGTLVLPQRLAVAAFVEEWLKFKADQVRETTPSRGTKAP